MKHKSNKHIWILSLFGVFVFSLSIGALIGAQFMLNDQRNTTSTDLDNSNIEVNNFSSIKTIEEFNKLMKEHQHSRQIFESPISFRATAEFTAVAQDAVSSKSSGGSDTNSRVSTTNNQIVGVDEADIVKLNNEYSFVIPNSYSSQFLEIIKLEDEGKLSKVDTFEYNIENDRSVTFQKMLLNANNTELYVFGSYSIKVPRVSSYDYSIYDQYEQKFVVLKLDITDLENIQVVDTIEFSEQFQEARLVGDIMYVTFEEYNYYEMPSPFFSYRIAEGKTTLVDDIRYMHFPQNPKTLTFGAISTSDFEDSTFESYLIEGYSTLYLNEDTAVIAYKNRIDVDRANIAREVLLDELPQKIANEISELSQEEFVLRLNTLFEEGEVSKLVFENVDERIQELYKEAYLEEYTSTILKFNLDKTTIEFVGKSEFKGEVLNQFSIDVYDDNVRIATKLSDWTLGDDRQSGVVTFDSELNILDELYEIAPGENMYSARFLGDRLYLVTFEQIDPLFVINLSNPKDIKIEGELKIPGFSEYLHPFNDELLIGIGKETKLTKDERVQQAGVKVSLFDVSDVNNPKEVDVEVFGNSWGSSLVGQDHKAFLLDTERNFMVVPIQFREDSESWEYWYGAVVLDISENGLDEITRLEHRDVQVKDLDKKIWYNSYSNRIIRSTFVDDVLYTYSENQMVSHDITNKFEDIDSLEFSKRDFEDIEIYY